MAPAADLLPGRFDLVFRMAISLGDVHGYGVLWCIGHDSGGVTLIQKGAPDPALFRLEHKGAIAGRWASVANDRRARFHQLTTLERRQCAQAHGSRQRLVDAIARSLTAVPQET